MAEAALFGIAKSALQQLTSPALDEFRLLWGHKAQLEKLEDTLTTIRNVLDDADRRQATDVAVQGWLAQLRTALYEADDLFEVISAKFLLEKDKNLSKVGRKVHHFLSKPYSFAFLVKNAHKVKEIRERLDDIANDMNRFNFMPVQTEQDQPYRIRREQTHSYVPRNEVVGREQEREDIVKMLLPESFKEQRGVSVIAVIGIGGLGKTTLAQLVYNDERVQQGFDLCMWACINYFSNLKQVLIMLLKSATKIEREDLDLDQLQILLREEIEGKRFLLVLDDVWDEDPQNWRELKHLLCSGKDGSKILTSTRSELVARSLCAIEPYFHLQGMSNESAWLLFKKIAFGEEEEQHSRDLEPLGQQIVKKCANVPLAIVTIASLLRHKEKRKWFPLVNDELSKVFPSEYKKITRALEISYNELPYPVKRCFGYCCLFPKDYIFEKSELVRLWIAQGFVEPLMNQSLEDRAEEYFFCLAERCFFQHTAIDKEMKNVRGYTCQMHDLMLDMAKEVARLECISVDQTTHSSWNKTIRHVSLNCQSKTIVDHVSSFSHSKSLRTFLCLHKFSLEKKALSKLMSGFRSLRVLDLSDMGIKRVPSSIGALIHLRFLDLSRNYMKKLPSSMCRLRNLQSLVLQQCELLKELPEELGNLVNLRHLMLRGCYSLFKMPRGLTTLTSLVTLDRLVVHNPRSELQYLECLDSLSGCLETVFPGTEWQNAAMDTKRSFLARKSRLHALAITWEIGEQEISFLEPEKVDTAMNALQPHPNLEGLSIRNFYGKEMPHWVMCLHNLVVLKLVGCELCVDLPPLSQLRFLKELHIQCMPSMLSIEDSKFYKPDLFFPSLEALSIWDMPNLTSWWLQAPIVLPSFPRVTKVDISHCPKLTRCMPLCPLVEVLDLESVQEEIIWQAIGTEATRLASKGNSVLKRLEIFEVGGLRSIAEDRIRHLSALQVLRIKECKQLESVSWNGLAYLTSLEVLEISWCEKLNSCNDPKTGVRRIHLPRLKYLRIPTVNKSLFKGFKYMASVETVEVYCSFDQDLQEDEEDKGVSWKHLQKLSHMKLTFGETFSMRASQRLLHGFQDLTSLEKLALSQCKELYLSWRALLGLNHLRVLEIEDVEKVIDVDSDAMIQTQLISSSIRELSITGGSGEWVHDIPWKSFPFLEDLWLWGISNLEALPEGVEHLAALKSLTTNDIKGVRSCSSA